MDRRRTGPLAVAVFASGEGSTLEGLVGAMARAPADARVVAAVSDRPGTAAMGRADRLEVPTHVCSPRGIDPRRWSDAVGRFLRSARAELVVLAGYRSILPAAFLAEWRGRVINVHPSLLPAYGGPGMWGRRVLEATLRDGASETGATVHLVTESIDGGPVLLQVRLRISASETVESLRARLHPLEVELLSQATARFAEGSWPLPYDPPASPAGRLSTS